MKRTVYTVPLSNMKFTFCITSNAITFEESVDNIATLSSICLNVWEKNPSLSWAEIAYNFVWNDGLGSYFLIEILFILMGTITPFILLKCFTDTLYKISISLIQKNFHLDATSTAFVFIKTVYEYPIRNANSFNTKNVKLDGYYHATHFYQTRLRTPCIKYQ